MPHWRGLFFSRQFLVRFTVSFEAHFPRCGGRFFRPALPADDMLGTASGPSARTSTSLGSMHLARGRRPEGLVSYPQIPLRTQIKMREDSIEAGADSSEFITNKGIPTPGSANPQNKPAGLFLLRRFVPHLIVMAVGAFALRQLAAWASSYRTGHSGRGCIVWHWPRHRAGISR